METDTIVEIKKKCEQIFCLSEEMQNEIVPVLQNTVAELTACWNGSAADKYCGILLNASEVIKKNGIDIQNLCTLLSEAVDKSENQG